MPWLLASPGHQHPWYWLCRICKSLSFMRKDFNYLAVWCQWAGMIEIVNTRLCFLWKNWLVKDWLTLLVRGDGAYISRGIWAIVGLYNGLAPSQRHAIIYANTQKEVMKRVVHRKKGNMCVSSFREMLNLLTAGPSSFWSLEQWVNTLRRRRNDKEFADDIFKCNKWIPSNFTDICFQGSNQQ